MHKIKNTVGHPSKMAICFVLDGSILLSIEFLTIIPTAKSGATVYADFFTDALQSMTVYVCKACVG